MESSMPGVQAAVKTSVPAFAAAVGAACAPCGMAAVLLPGTGISQPARTGTSQPARTGTSQPARTGISQPARLGAVVDASKPLPKQVPARVARQDAPQHNPQKFAYKNRLAAISGAAAGPHPAWDPV